jgi:hypothetical protein
MVNENKEDFINLNNPLHNFFSNYDAENNNLFLFMDGNNNIWELIRRVDLDYVNLSKKEEIISFNKLISDFNLFNKEKNILQVIDDEDLACSLDYSELEMSKATDMNNLSHMIKETMNDISDLY